MVIQDNYIEPLPHPPDFNPLKQICLVASIAAAIQYGWALQLSLLTPYTQFLGLNHKWVSLIWLCGPISGLIVQPLVGQYSDRCRSSYGRRRPFIMAGALLLSLGVLLIGFSADIGVALGDSLELSFKYRSVIVFVLGFWLLDIANNAIQGPCRALLADISGDDAAMVTLGNALFAFFMAVGNIIGYIAGANMNLYRVLPFTKTEACNVYCANLKTCFLFSILLTTIVIMLIISFVKEEIFDPSYAYHRREDSVEEKPPSLIMQLVIATRSQPKPMLILYTVTALNWIGCFPFLLYDTDWMGKEVYGGNPSGNSLEFHLYDQGVRAGSMGLMLYVVTLGAVSLFMDILLRLFGNARRLWSIGNFILGICMGMTVIITKMAESARETTAIDQDLSAHPPPQVKIFCFALFSALGIPQAITYSIPFALASIYSKDSGTGQGLALGLLNLAIVIPQIVVALISGPLDSLFGSSNLPAFMLGGTTAVMGGIFSMKMLPVD